VCDFADTFFLCEAHFNHAALVRRQCSGKAKKSRGVLDYFRVCIGGGQLHGRGNAALFSGALPMVGNRIGSNSKQPCVEGNSSPFEPAKIRQGLVKHFGRQILRLIAVADAAHDVRVDPLKIAFVEFGEEARVFLDCFDQAPLVRLFFGKSLQQVLRVRLSYYETAGARKGYGRWQDISQLFAGGRKTLYAAVRLTAYRFSTLVLERIEEPSAMDEQISSPKTVGQADTDHPPSDLQTIFYGPNGLRAGWRALIFIFLVVVTRYAVIALVQFGVRTFGGTPATALGAANTLYPRTVATTDAVLFTIILIPSILMGFIENRRLADYGLPWKTPFPKNFWVGALWGFLGISSVLFVMFLLHGCRITGVDIRSSDFAPAFLEWAGAFLLVGFFEEFTFRGYMQFTLTTGIGYWPAALITSILFLAAHTGNPGETVFGVIQVAMFGIFLSIVLWRTGNLWWAIGFHLAWDWGQTFFYGVPDSGFKAGRNFLHSEFHGPNWLTGGTAGPEASILTLIALIVLSLLVLRFYPKVRYPDPKALGSHSR